MELSRLYEQVDDFGQGFSSFLGWDCNIRRFGDRHAALTMEKYESAAEAGYGRENSFKTVLKFESASVDTALLKAAAGGEGQATVLATVTEDKSGRDEVGAFDQHSTARHIVNLKFEKLNDSRYSCRHSVERDKCYPPDISQFGVVLQAQFMGVDGPDENGLLVKVLEVPWLGIFREIMNDRQTLFEFSKHPRKFEEFIAATYERAGWDEVVLTPASGDRGRDVIATKHGIGSVRILDQCKAFSEPRSVSANDVRALIGVLSTDPGASKGAVTTTTSFAPGVWKDPSIQPMIPHRLELRSGDDLVQWLANIS